MTWSIPSAKTILARIAASAETGLLSIKPEASSAAISRAVRSTKGVFAQIFGAVAPELSEVHDHIAWWGRQYMPDSADDEAMILRHASIWGIEQRAAKTAVGTVLIAGTAGAVLASGITLTASNSVAYITTAGGTISAGGTLTVAAKAVEAGDDGNLEAGVKLSITEANSDITSVTVATAFSGGADAETPEDMQVRTLERIREPPKGGSATDYKAWVGEIADVYAVSVVEDWIGRGSLGIVIVMADENGNPRVPTDAELADIGAYLGAQGSQTGVRPVTARVIPVAGVLVEVPVSVRLRPDTTTTRAAVTEAFARFIKTIGDEDDDTNTSPIGAVIEPSRISEVISAAEGEYGHDLAVPASKYTLASNQCPIVGTITWLD
ncbi:putative phage protein gp47/JayE [Agrobacterium vitis]|nr:putative phage protein gp47/JayE [Agrobacterium vitis]MBE1440558.1 putative phage protein gp47/JayE [Agrobacterium vitis]